MSSSNKGFYITTAIAYPNNRMHVGYAWEVIATDSIARFQRMQGTPVFFCTGVDEHSQNVEKAALAKGVSAQAYCDGMASDIRAIMDQMDVAYDRFIRTSDEDHMKVCQNLIERAYKAGDVYKQKYEGLYCDSCEIFYTEKDLLNDQGQQHCPVHKIKVRSVSEENYFFKLSKFQQQIESLLDEGFLQPDFRAQEIREFVKQGLKDFSVSRTSFKFGIPVPWEPSHVIYVWYDALINYLSAVKYLTEPEFFKKFWPCDVHVIGKDITRFHSVYWPAMLLSTHGDGGQPIALPNKVFAHGFIQLNGEKMSKTRGNIVTPDAVIADYGVTSLRWYLLAANQFSGDGNYSDEDLILKCNADLSNNMGNLVNRVVSMSRKYFQEKLPQNKSQLPDGVLSVSMRMMSSIGERGEFLKARMEAMDVSGYCSLIQEFSMALNKFVDECKPWALAKDPTKADVLETVIAELLEGIRVLGVVLWPIIPQASQLILEQLGSEGTMKTQTTYAGRSLNVPQWSEVLFSTQSKLQLKDPKPLFVRLEKNTQ